jgi:hypothetical protein
MSVVLKGLINIKRQRLLISHELPLR